MIIQSKFRRCVSQRTMGRLAAGSWVLAIMCGTLLAACSGTIDTPTEEFPARQAGDDSPAAAPAAPARAPAAAPAATPAAPTRTPAASAPAASGAGDGAAAAPDTSAAAAEPPAAAPTTTASADLSFEKDIWPIFQESCVPCHQTLKSGGHNIGSDDLDEAFSDAKSFKGGVLADIESGSMPLGCGSPPGGSGCVSADDYASIQAWYDAGSPK